MVGTRDTQEQREKRRHTAYQMVLQGLPVSLIAQKLGYGKRQIELDLKFVRNEIAGTLKKQDYFLRMADYNARQNERIKRWWTVISDPKSNKRDIAKALTELRNEDEQMLKKDQIIGLLPKEQSPLTIETNTDGEGISNIQVNIIQQQEVTKKVDIVEAATKPQKVKVKSKK